MKFYDIDSALQEAIVAADKPVRLKIEIDLGNRFESVFEQDIVEANFYSLKEAAGGVSSRGEIVISNEQLAANRRFESNVRGGGVGLEVRVSFSIGEGLPYFQRFVFYIDDKGFQVIQGPGRKRYVRIGLRDLSARLRKTDEARDWTSPAVFTYSVVCDKTQPEKSLVHGIASRAGLAVGDIDCSTIAVTLPFVRLRRNVWAELSSLATAYRCHLECAPEKPLVFAHSPYQTNEKLEMSNRTYGTEECSYTFRGENIFYLRIIDRAELYRNTVRLKFNMPVALEKQEIWRYDEQPVFYDEFLQAHYPFKFPLVREIETGNYEANYKITDVLGKERNVIFADDIDTQEEAENRLDYDGGAFSYSHYDVTTHYDKAILKLQKDNDGDIYNASIFGKPIVLDLNRSCYMRDIEAVERYGTVALNVTGSYFSDDVVNKKSGISITHYEDWVIRELAERIQNRREFSLKTHRGLFNARVGAKVKVKSEKIQENIEAIGKITALSFRYKRDEAFIATFKIIETEVNDG